MGNAAEPRGSGASRIRVLSWTVKIGLGLVLLACLFGIMLTGPIIVKPTPIRTGATADAERLRANVNELVSEFHPRDAGHPENLQRAASWIATSLRESGLGVEFQDYELDGGRFRNVIGTSPGSDPGAGALVIGAHYDAFEGSPGADDNASGVAVLLELARTLPQPSARGTRYFVAFSTREPPYSSTNDMGSARFAASLAERGVTVELMIALDTVGHYGYARGSQGFPFPGLGLLYPRRGNFAAIVGDLGSGEAIRRVKAGMLATESLPVVSFRAPAFVGAVHRSDHLPFRKQGVPAVQVTDTASLRSPAYHTREDTPEKLDYDRMARLVEALHGVLWDPDVP